MSIRKNAPADQPEPIALPDDGVTDRSDYPDVYEDEPSEPTEEPTPKKERKQTPAGRLGAAAKRVKVLKAKIEKAEIAKAAADTFLREQADALEEATREQAAALAAFTEGN